MCRPTLVSCHFDSLTNSLITLLHWHFIDVFSRKILHNLKFISYCQKHLSPIAKKNYDYLYDLKKTAPGSTYLGKSMDCLTRHVERPRLKNTNRLHLRAPIRKAVAKTEERVLLCQSILID